VFICANIINHFLQEQLRNELEYVKSEAKNYKDRYDLILNQNVKLQVILYNDLTYLSIYLFSDDFLFILKKNQLNQLQKCVSTPSYKSISKTPGTMDTIVSESDVIDELSRECTTPESSYPETSATTPSSFFCQASKDFSDLARLVNCDLALCNLTTSNTPKEIWQNLNERCINKFGNKDCIKDNTTIEDVMWACKMLPAYLSWNTMECYYDDIKKWIAKVNQFCNNESEINNVAKELADENNGSENSEYNK
jgi:hypothetical protein